MCVRPHARRIAYQNEILCRQVAAGPAQGSVLELLALHAFIAANERGRRRGSPCDPCDTRYVKVKELVLS